MTVQIITIDGPSGSGKGTLAAKIAAHYQFHLLDSGALYRLLGLSLHQQDLLDALSSELSQCVEIAKHLDIQFLSSAQGTQVLLNGEDVSQTIRTERVGEFASKVATIPELRAALVDRQHAFAQAPGLVADGRDMGTVVFPDSAHKFYLTASAEIRAERRLKQLNEQGLSANICDLIQDINARDERDSNRPVAPLKPATDAILIDTSFLDQEGVFNEVWQHIQASI